MGIIWNNQSLSFSWPGQSLGLWALVDVEWGGVSVRLRARRHKLA